MGFLLSRSTVLYIKKRERKACAWIIGAVVDSNAWMINDITLVDQWTGYSHTTFFFRKLCMVCVAIISHHHVSN